MDLLSIFKGRNKNNSLQADKKQVRYANPIARLNEDSTSKIDPNFSETVKASTVTKNTKSPEV